MASNIQENQGTAGKLRIRFDQLRADVITKLNECSDCIAAAEKLDQETTTAAAILESKLVNASNEEKEWKDIKVKLAATSVSGKVILDVGGEKYTTSVETLTREKETFFTALFSKQWQLERDPDDKSIFIDRDGKLFYHILAYLRTGKVPNDIMSNESLRQQLIVEAEYFRLHDLIHQLTEPERKKNEEEEEGEGDEEEEEGKGDEEEEEEDEEEEAHRVSDSWFPGGTLLVVEHKRKLNEFFGKNDQRWELIYKASRDGFDANAFHSRCDNKGSTITIIRSNNNYLFGGYATLPWTSQGSYKSDTSAFLFTLINPHAITPTKYVINPTLVQFAVCHHNGTHGSTFGGGHDLHVAGASNANNISYTNFPHTYSDTTGKGNNTFTGTRNFTSSDIEVYKLV